ncbi:uncharacterized protein LOC116293387 [Actinia tenebrosa]|uniref:Uncharacterized protein LOC116293387 n=1 Tax=Actinia tenebrosa TaxID=6105 RepID=A0A6P8HLP7_ACTTE|nr:uncharacterized protein LOC116293387 [Actinia tenebrosa]
MHVSLTSLDGSPNVETVPHPSKLFAQSSTSLIRAYAQFKAQIKASKEAKPASQEEEQTTASLIQAYGNDLHKAETRPTLQEEENAKWFTHPETHKRYLIHSPDTPKEIANDIRRGIGKVLVTNHGILRRIGFLPAWNTYTFAMVNPPQGPHIHSGESSLIEAYAQWKIKVSKDALRTYEQKEEKRKAEERKERRKQYIKESRDRWMASNGHTCVCSCDTCTY